MSKVYSEIVGEALVATKAYQDLLKPVILAGGELGIYYINTEKILGDNGAWEQFGDDSVAMIKHAIHCAENNLHFGRVIKALTDHTRQLLGRGTETSHAISGGQRRDWLFSGPVSYNLNIRHFSLYKQSNSPEDDMLQIVLPTGEKCMYVDGAPKLSGWRVVHGVDLITEGSSCYRVEGRKLGWIPMIRERGATIEDLTAVVTRSQGGEEMLAKQDVKTHSFVSIDADFLSRYSTDPERAIEYAQNPSVWSEKYLVENGALGFLETFNPKGNKFDRARRFVDRYEKTLRECGRWEDLEQAVRKKYGIILSDEEPTR